LVVVQKMVFVMCADAHITKTQVVLHEEPLWCAALAPMGIVGTALHAHHAHLVQSQQFRYQASV